MATSYTINYDDQRFKDVETDKQAALSKVNSTYDNMISKSDQYYDQQIQASKDYATTQSKLQQEKTDQAIAEINQQKDQTKKDYIKEQSGAYTDWQKQSNQYGVKAEQMAAQGMTNTGYSETSQVNMYTAYQNRVASARDTFNKAILNYDNMITNAQLQNNSKLAEIAYNALQMQLELGLAGFQYKNSLLTQQLETQLQLDETYYNRWQDVLAQMNTENALAEEIRQFNKSMSSGGSYGGSYSYGGSNSSNGTLKPDDNKPKTPSGNNKNNSSGGLKSFFSGTVDKVKKLASKLTKNKSVKTTTTKKKTGKTAARNKAKKK